VLEYFHRVFCPAFQPAGCFILRIASARTPPLHLNRHEQNIFFCWTQAVRRAGRTSGGAAWPRSHPGAGERCSLRRNVTRTAVLEDSTELVFPGISRLKTAAPSKRSALPSRLFRQPVKQGVFLFRTPIHDYGNWTFAHTCCSIFPSTWSKTGCNRRVRADPPRR
jgi:hypothetical protein